jgi:3-phosphoshikimate 1-carboxyvinyltransferase
LEGGNTNLTSNISSQYLSALLMVSPFAKTETTINIEGALVSKPYIEMTIKIMEKFGIEILNNNFAQFEIKKAKPSINKPKSLVIESDTSSASYIGAFAALNPKIKILLKNIHENSIQGDIKFLEYLQTMGCKTSTTKNGIIIQGPAKLLPLGSLDMNTTPDLVMTFAVLSMFTEGKTTLANIGNLRVKESDRLSALKTEIRKFGIQVHTGPDFIEIHGNLKLLSSKPKSPITIETYDDHRIAMAFGILKNHLPIKIQNPSCVNKSYKTFWLDLNKLIQNAKR